MGDPMSRKAAIERVVAMRFDSGTTWDLSEKDQEALRHAVQAFSDVEVLRREVARLKDALRICGEAGCPTAAVNAKCGCGDSNCNDCAGAER